MLKRQVMTLLDDCLPGGAGCAAIPCVSAEWEGGHYLSYPTDRPTEKIFSSKI
jgi:hypothetical protein